MSDPAVQTSETSAATGAPGDGQAGNRRVLKALVIGPVLKDRGVAGESKALPEDEFDSLVSEGKVLAPPFDKLLLSMLPEQSTVLGPLIDAMETNIDGFGHRLECRVRIDDPSCSPDLREAVRRERVRLINFFTNCCSDITWDEHRGRTRRDVETTGEAFWEVLRAGPEREIVGFVHLPSYQMRLGPQEASFTEYQVTELVAQPDGSFALAKRPALRRFRQFVQARSAMSTRVASDAVGSRVRWFKEFGDPRAIDCRTGEVVPAGKQIDPRFEASEVYHWRLYSPRTPHGLPRFIGNLITIFGDRAADEINFVTLRNNNVPSQMVLVSNGRLTADSIERIREYVETQIHGTDNWSRWLLIEVEESMEGGESGGKASIQVKPMVDVQMRDQMFQEYGLNNRTKMRAAFRMPPIFIGLADEYSRATAEASRRLADEQVFAPERRKFDGRMNKDIMPALGVLYHQFVSNGPNVTDDEDLIRVLQAAERSGGMTPRLASLIIADVLNRDDLPMPAGIPLDKPFSITMAEAVKNLGPMEVGAQVTALKEGDPATAIRSLLDVRERLERELARRTGS